MKKILFTIVMMFVVIVVNAVEYRTVKYVKIGNFEQGVSVYFTNGGSIHAAPGSKDARWIGFIRTLRSGDIVSFEDIDGYTVDFQKIGHENPSIHQNGGVIYTGRNYGCYYGGGSASVGYTSKDGRTNVGVGTYRNYDGSTTAVVGGNVAGFHFEVPVTVKKKASKATTTTSATTTTTRTSTPATVKTVKTGKKSSWLQLQRGSRYVIISKP